LILSDKTIKWYIKLSILLYPEQCKVIFQFMLGPLTPKLTAMTFNKSVLLRACVAKKRSAT